MMPNPGRWFVDLGGVLAGFALVGFCALYLPLGCVS